MYPYIRKNLFYALRVESLRFKGTANALFLADFNDRPELEGQLNHCSSDLVLYSV